MSNQYTKPESAYAAEATAREARAVPASVPLTRVTVVDFDMSFMHLVGFFVKAAFAAIPAAIIIAIVIAIIVAVFGGLVGGLGHMGRWS